jgi:hypothetical protein
VRHAMDGVAVLQKGNILVPAISGRAPVDLGLVNPSGAILL